MTREEFEQHINGIIEDAWGMEKYLGHKSGVFSDYSDSLISHREKLMDFYDALHKSDESQTLQSLQNEKDDIEFHLYWRCSPDTFEYESYEEKLQEIQKKIDKLKKEE